jgi:LemA protein
MRAKEAWSILNTHLDKEHNLVLSLVERVQQQNAYDQKIFDRILQAHNMALEASSPERQAAAEEELKLALKPLFTGVLDHPEIEADTEFVNLREEFAIQEDNIRYWRDRYNSIAVQLNTIITRFPHRIIARRLQMKQVEYYSGDRR